MYSFETKSRKEYLEAVKEDGEALEYVKEQDKEICLEAVKQNGHALKCVKDFYKELLEIDSPYLEEYKEAFKIKKEK